MILISSTSPLQAAIILMLRREGEEEQTLNLSSSKQCIKGNAVDEFCLESMLQAMATREEEAMQNTKWKGTFVLPQDFTLET